MNQKSSLPPGHLLVTIFSAFWNVGQIFKHRISLSLIVILVISYSSVMYYIEGWKGIFGFVLPLSIFVIFVTFAIWFVSLFVLRIRIKYIVYKIRRHQLLKKTYKGTEQQEKIDLVIEKYNHHLEFLKHKSDPGFELGI